LSLESLAFDFSSRVVFESCAGAPAPAQLKSSP
jgi:hypothetical protein